MSRAAAPLPVNIRKNADVDNEIVNLRISEGEQLAWSADPQSGGFTIDFPITPFASKTFVVPAGQCVPSGPIKSDAPITLYFYKITNNTSGEANDPGVNIKP